MRKFGVLSLVLGIVGLTTSFFLVGLIFCIVALVFGILYMIKIRKSIGKAIAGMACACVGLLISLIMIIAIVTSSSEEYNDFTGETTASEIQDLSDVYMTTDSFETKPTVESQTTEHFTEPSGEGMTEPQTTKPIVVPTEPQTTKPTVVPTEPQTTKPTVEPIDPPTAPPSSTLVLVWIVENGTRYHCDSSCSNMRSPYQVTIEDAKNKGLTACKRCY